MIENSLLRYFVSTIIAITYSVCLIAAFAGPVHSQPARSGSTGHTVKIGAALSLTGSMASVGQSVRKGMALAQQEVNAKGLPKIIFRVEDTTSTVSGAVDAVKTLVEIRKVPVIIGPIRSSATLAAAPVAEKNRTILFTPASVAEKISQAGEYVFRNRETARFHGTKAAEFFIGRQINKVGLLAAQSDNSVSYVDFFRVAYGEKGGAVVYYGEYEEKANDLRTLILRAKEAGAEALYIVPTTGADAGLIVRQVREQQFAGTIVGTILFESPEFLEAAGAAAEGVMYTYPAFDPTKGAGKEFALKYRKRFGMVPDTFAANAYDAVKIIAEGIRACGTVETDCLKDHILNVKNYRGAGGKTTFDENGDVQKPILIKQVSAGSFTIVPDENPQQTKKKQTS